ncbi:hypothetical protein D5041_07765 [Verminephrobacter aporrectodeae subsp. tuberculatae]|nr:hypothetical protein [Verminephrobacter aporrectodeae subsp. tuberculatae]MCW5288960.1 hypothetical protein [Verminephrobacter aporrectodeae subsp. tuberculatae]
MIVDDGAAAQALQAALEMSAMGSLLIRYLALFRPAKNRLTWPRVAALLGELLPLIQQERLERNGQLHEAPLHAWASAIEKTIAARDAGALRPPLKTHGYLFEVVIAESARASAHAAMAAQSGQAASMARPLSSTAQAIARLEQRKRGDFK